MMKPKFSVITPVHVYDAWRLGLLHRAIESVQKQTFRNFEHIVINDGSTFDAKLDFPKVKILNQPHLERIIALNLGFKEAQGEWICLLDSDDEYVSYYLEACNKMINKYFGTKVFNFGSIHITLDYKAIARDAFKPKKLKKGHEVFGPGKIVNGTFIFKKDCLDKVGMFPKTSSPWDFSTMAQKEFPEIKPLFTVKHPDHPKGLARELGNPWGNDYFLFYKLTRRYHSVPFDCHLYITHPSRKRHQL